MRRREALGAAEPSTPPVRAVEAVGREFECNARNVSSAEGPVATNPGKRPAQPMQKFADSRLARPQLGQMEDISGCIVNN
jgi:hypothetical protein